MTKTTCKRWLVRIDFLDHADCEVKASLVPSRVWGVLVAETPEAYHVLKWECPTDPDNSEYWAIAKGAVTEFEKIREEE